MSQPRRICAAFAALLALTLAGCTGAGPGPSEPPPTTQGGDTTTPSPTPSTPSPTPSTTSPTPKPTVEEVAYVPWGPADPVIPDHYGELARRDCDAAEEASPKGEFWTVVYGVCRALTQGDAWPEVSTAPALPQTDNPHEQCLNAELGTMVEGALAWHATNPGATAHADYPETGSPCFTTVYSSSQLTPDEDGTGPGAGQVTVAVVIDSTYDLASVSVDGSAVDRDTYFDAGNDGGTRTVNVHVAAPEQASRITIDLSLSLDGDARGTATTTVDLAPTSDGSLAPDDTASPSDSTDGTDGTESTDSSDGSEAAERSDDSESAGADGS